MNSSERTRSAQMFQVLTCALINLKFYVTARGKTRKPAFTSDLNCLIIAWLPSWNHLFGSIMKVKESDTFCASSYFYLLIFLWRTKRRLLNKAVKALVCISHKTAARCESFNNSRSDYLKKEFQNIDSVSITFTADETNLVKATAHKSGTGIQTT